MNVSMIKESTFNLLSSKSNYESFTACMRDINKALKVKEEIDSKTLLSEEYWDFADVVSRKLIDTRSSHRFENHIISLIDGQKSSFCALQGMSQNELFILKKYFKEHLTKGFIWMSSSSVVVSVFFAKKSGNELKFCVDYQVLNNITVNK